MKTKLFLGAFIFGFNCLQAQSTLKSDCENITAENKILTTKIDSFYRASRSEINSRLKKTDRLTHGAKDPANILPTYEEDWVYFGEILQKAKSHAKTLEDQNALIKQDRKDIRAEGASVSDKEKENLSQGLDILSIDNDNSKGKLKEIRKNCQKLFKKSGKRLKKLKKLVARNQK